MTFGLEELSQPGPRRRPRWQTCVPTCYPVMRRKLAERAVMDDAFLEDAAQETLLRVLDRLDTFAGRGRFMSWALAISVRVALSTIRKQRWQGVSLDRFKEQSSGQIMAVVDQSLGPERASLRSELLAAMHRVIREQLTDKQWLALTAELNGMPQDDRPRLAVTAMLLPNSRTTPAANSGRRACRSRGIWC